MGQDGEDGEGRPVLTPQQHADEVKHAVRTERNLAWKALIAVEAVVIIVLIHAILVR